MKRFRMFFRFDKEEKWLEEMAGNGWLLCGKGLCYEFLRCTPDRCTIRVDYREFKNRGEFEDYKAMFEDSGWKHLAGSRGSGTQYFLKLSDCGTEDIFSDGMSRAGRYKRMANAWLCAAVALLPLMVVYFTQGYGRVCAPGEWYLTPGLWEMKGMEFWWAFAFETPFAVGRGVGWLFPCAPILMYLVYAVKSWQLYRREAGKGLGG